MGILELGPEADSTPLNPLPTTPRGPGDMVSLYFQRQRLVDQWGSRDRNMYDAYEQAIEQYRTATGRTLPNPFAFPETGFGSALTGLPNLRGQLRDQVHAALTEARTTHPDLPDPATIEPGANQRVLDRVEAIDRARRVSGGAIPFLIGNAAAAFTDPINLATLPFGAPARLAGSMGVRILRAALIEGGIAGASQAVSEVGAVPYRRELGVESNAPGDILAAAAGGAVLGGAFRALVEGVIALRGGRLSQAERDAIVAGARADADHESNPLGAVRAPEHEARLDAADAAVRRGQPLREELLGSTMIARAEPLSAERLAAAAPAEPAPILLNADTADRLAASTVPQVRNVGEALQLLASRPAEALSGEQQALLVDALRAIGLEPRDGQGLAAAVARTIERDQPGAPAAAAAAAAAQPAEPGLGDALRQTIAHDLIEAVRSLEDGAAGKLPAPGEVLSPGARAMASLFYNGTRPASPKQIAARLAGYLDETARAELARRAAPPAPEMPAAPGSAAARPAAEPAASPAAVSQGARTRQVADGARAEAAARAEPTFNQALTQEARRIAADTDPAVIVREGEAAAPASKVLDDAEAQVAQAAEIEACVIGQGVD